VSTPVFNGRRADRFAELLDGESAAIGSGQPQDDDLEKLAAIGRRLSSIEFDLKVEPEFQTGLRAMLMATIERQGIGRTTVDPQAAREPGAPTHTVRVGRRRRRPNVALPTWYSPVRSRRARAAVLIGLAAGTLAVSGMSVASGDAVPGDTLYGIKRSTERAQLALAGSEVSRGQLYLEFAKNRTNEASAVLDDPQGLASVLSDLDAETRQGIRQLTTAAVDRREPAPLELVDAFVTVQRSTLRDMQAGVNGAAWTRLDSSIALLDEIKRRSAAIRATLACDDLGRTLDALGPLAGHCLPAAPPAKSPVSSHNTPANPVNQVTPSPSESAVPTTPSMSPSSPGPTEPLTGVLPSDLPT
jgi:hypothetical protein